MSWECFDVSVSQQIAHIVLNRPEKRNSMCQSFWSDLPAIVQDIDENAKARVIVISSTGPHFSAGIDLEMLTSEGIATGDRNDPRHAAALMATVGALQLAFTTLESSRIPVLAAIQGGCFGGAVDLITACDLRYATADAFFTIYEINVGMTADVGTFPRIVKLIPEGVARELAYTGRRMPAEEARSAGLVNAVWQDQEAMLAGVMSVAQEIAEKPPLAVYGCKRAITYARDHSTSDALDHIAVWNAGMLNPGQIREALRAGQEQRPPEFSDLPRISRDS